MYMVLFVHHCLCLLGIPHLYHIVLLTLPSLWNNLFLRFQSVSYWHFKDDISLSCDPYFKDCTIIYAIMYLFVAKGANASLIVFTLNIFYCSKRKWNMVKEKTIVNSFYLDPTEDRTRDLLHSRWARLTITYRSSLKYKIKCILEIK